ATLIPLLSRYGYGPGPARRLDVLFPLFHYARDEESFSIASYPFFDWHESGAKSRLGILFWLYRRYVDEEAGTRSHNILFPLSSFRSAEDGAVRSEEHTSELQSRENLVCRLLLEKKKNHL